MSIDPAELQQAYIALYAGGIIDKEHELGSPNYPAPGYSRKGINIMEVYIDGNGQLNITNRHAIHYGYPLTDWPAVTGFAFTDRDGNPKRGSSVMADNGDGLPLPAGRTVAISARDITINLSIYADEQPDEGLNRERKPIPESPVEREAREILERLTGNG